MVTRLGAKELVSEYIALDDKAKEIKKRQDDLKKDIKAWVEAEVAADAKGNQKVEFDDGNRVELIVRQTVKIDEESAVRILKSLNLSDCFDEVVAYVLNENMIEQRVRDGAISEDQLRDMTSIKENKALYIKGAKDK